MLENLDSLMQTVEKQLIRVFPDAECGTKIQALYRQNPLAQTLEYDLKVGQGKLALAYNISPPTEKVSLQMRLFMDSQFLFDDTLDPTIESDLIGGFAYINQILRANQKPDVSIQALSDSTPTLTSTPTSVSDFPTGTYRATRFFAIKRAHEPGSVGFDPSKTINIITNRGETLANGQPVNLKSLWNAYRQEYLNPVDVPSAHVKTTYPLTINVKDSSEVLQFDSNATFDIGSGYILMPDGSLISVLPTEQLSLLERRLLIIVS